MANNLTDNSFKNLPLHGKIRRICREPRKAGREFLYKALSVIGHSSYTPFLILTRDRTGSNMLVQYLNSHPAVRCEYEALARLDGQPGPVLVKRIYSNQPFFIRAKGFKIFYYHPIDLDEIAQRATWESLASIPGLRLIHLRRNNVLETAVSSKLAYETGVYGDVGGKAASVAGSVLPRKVMSIYYPADKLQAVFEQTRRWEEVDPKRFSNCPQLEITYEELTADPESEMTKVCRFLGIDQPFKPQTNFRKQRTKSLRQILSNYDELKQHFANSVWAEFFIE